VKVFTKNSPSWTFFLLGVGELAQMTKEKKKKLKGGGEGRRQEVRQGEASLWDLTTALPRLCILWKKVLLPIDSQKDSKGGGKKKS